jgi:hypothetical protein
MFTRLVSVVALTALVQLGCTAESTAPIGTPPFTTTDLTGTWTIGFQAQGSMTMVFGEIVISAQHDSQLPDYLMAQFTADFHPILGRQVSCLQMPQASLVRMQDSVTIQLLFTPGAADCGLFAGGPFAGNSFTGNWIEPSFTAQPLSSGTFWMWRKS